MCSYYYHIRNVAILFCRKTHWKWRVFGAGCGYFMYISETSFFLSLCSWHFCLFITISWMNGQEKKRQFMYEYIEWNSNKMWAETESVITGSWSNNLYKKCVRGMEGEEERDGEVDKKEQGIFECLIVVGVVRSILWNSKQVEGSNALCKMCTIHR